MPQNGSIPLVIYMVFFFHIYFHFSVQAGIDLPFPGKELAINLCKHYLHSKPNIPNKYSACIT